MKSSFLRPFQLRGKLRSAQRIIPKPLFFRQSRSWVFPLSLEARRLRAHSESPIFERIFCRTRMFDLAASKCSAILLF